MDDQIKALLPVDDQDAGCAAGEPIMDRYVEIELAGGDPGETFPGTAAHLRVCRGCRADHDGLLELARDLGDPGPTSG